MFENDIRSWVKHLDFIFLDLISITVSYWLTFLWRINLQNLSWESYYRGFYAIILAFHIILIFFFRSYSNIIRRSVAEECLSVCKHNIFLMGCSLVYLVFSHQARYYSRLFLGGVLIANIVIMCVFRIVWKQFVRKHLKTKDKLPRILVITNDSLAEKCLQKLNDKEYQSFRISGIVLLEDETDCIDVAGISVVAHQSDMLEYIRLNVVDQVIIHVNEISDIVNSLIHQLVQMGIVVHISLDVLDSMPHKQINQMGNLSVITTCLQTASTLQLFLKRTMDICGALVGLFITVIAFVFVAPVIFIKSPGPIFFSQYRIGKNGRKFRIYKFRSMYMDAEERKKELMQNNKMQGFMFKMDNDPRIIKGIGHFIRNTSIDELPQFWNILKGDMSLVGTRPPTVDEFEKYSYHHKVRLSFRPGLTGMWQVSGRSDITDFEEVVRLDGRYIENWSIWLDIKIIIKTIVVVLQRKGSE